MSKPDDKAFKAEKMWQKETGDPSLKPGISILPLLPVMTFALCLLIGSFLAFFVFFSVEGGKATLAETQWKEVGKMQDRLMELNIEAKSLYQNYGSNMATWPPTLMERYLLTLAEINKGREIFTSMCLKTAKRFPPIPAELNGCR